MALLGGRNNSVIELFKIEIATNSVIHNVLSYVWMNTYIYYRQYVYVCERHTIKILNCRQNEFHFLPIKNCPNAWRDNLASSSELWSEGAASQEMWWSSVRPGQFPGSGTVMTSLRWVPAIGFVKESWKGLVLREHGLRRLPPSPLLSAALLLWGATPLVEATNLTISVSHKRRLVHVPTCNVERPHNTREIGWVQKSITQIMRVNYPRSESASDLPKQSWKQALRDEAALRRLTACRNKPNTLTKPAPTNVKVSGPCLQSQEMHKSNKLWPRESLGTKAEVTLGMA